jgi:hypothetical protein
MPVLVAVDPGEAMLRHAAFKEAPDDVLFDAAHETDIRVRVSRMPTANGLTACMGITVLVCKGAWAQAPQSLQPLDAVRFSAAGSVKLLVLDPTSRATAWNVPSSRKWSC